MRTIQAALVCLLIGTSANAQTVGTEPSKVLLKVDASSLTDRNWERLARAIATDVAVAEWPTVVVQQGEGLQAVIDRYYDIYPAARGPWAKPLPGTTQALAELILKANGLPGATLETGQVLKVPPVPLRPQSSRGASASVRYFDPTSNAYAVLDPGRTERAARIRTVDDAAFLDALRGPGATVLAMSAQSAVSLADFTAVAGTGRLVSVELLQDSQCGSADTTIDESPYLAAARQQVATARARLIEAASKRKLVLVDFDFNDGHGAHVRSAARWLLHKLGAPELVKFVQDFELNPTHLRSKDALIPSTLAQPVRDYWEWGDERGVVQSGVEDTTFWLFTADPGKGKAIYTVPPVLLQAAVWQHVRQGSWLSLSWRITEASGALPVELQPMLKAGSFVVVAAGNEREEIRGDRTPQSAASTYRQFINVTHGDRAGRIFGSWTSSQGSNVDLIAPGCGFTFETLTSGRSGSSFAAPVVAAAAWLRHLIDGTPAADMRQALALASSLLPSNKERVLSGGVFDPARLIAAPGAHYLNTAGTQVVPVSNVTLTVEGCGTYLSSTTARQDVSVIADGGKFVLLRRVPVAEFPYVRVEPPCTFQKLDMRATDASGPLVISSPGDFIVRIRQISF